MTSSPWTISSLLRFVAVSGVALVLLVVGWVGVSGRVDTGEQLVWLNISVTGLLVSLWANGRLFLDGRRAIGLRARLLSSVEPAQPARSEPGREADDGALVAGDGLRRFHQRSCALAAGRGWAPADLSDHHAAGRSPCGVCRP